MGSAWIDLSNDYVSQDAQDEILKWIIQLANLEIRIHKQEARKYGKRK